MSVRLIFVSKLIQIFLLAAGTSCSQKPARIAAGTALRADVLSLDSSSIRQPADKPQYKYSEQSFTQITDASELSGPRLRMLAGGNLDLREITGERSGSGEFTGYRTPVLDYRLVEGVVKPRSSLSLAMLSSLYQFDLLVEKTEALTGSRFDDFFARQKELRIMFQPSVEIRSSSEISRKYDKYNAAHIAGTNQFALFSTGREERVPLGSNAQVISHEFAHAVFENSFFAGRYDLCRVPASAGVKLFSGRLETSFAIRGMNEGFADFFSYAWTGSANILESSLGNVVEAYERNFATTNFSYETFLSTGGKACQGGFYCLGSLWAKTLLEVFIARNGTTNEVDDRHLFLRNVVTLMGRVGNALRENDGARLPEPDAQARACEIRNTFSEVPDSEMLAAFLKAVVDSAEISDRPSFCAAIAKNFGDSGFPPDARGGCL